MTQFTGFRKHPRTVAGWLAEMTPEHWDIVAQVFDIIGPDPSHEAIEDYVKLLPLPMRQRHMIGSIARAYKGMAGPKDIYSHRPIVGTSFGAHSAGHECVYCGAAADHQDHVWPRSRGGGDESFNLVWACKSCNMRKGSRSILTDRCPTCGFDRDPGDVETSTGTAYYHCRCGRTWSRTWDLQHPMF